MSSAERRTIKVPNCIECSVLLIEVVEGLFRPVLDGIFLGFIFFDDAEGGGETHQLAIKMDYVIWQIVNAPDYAKYGG